MKKEIKVVMLPTEKAASDISKGNKTGILNYHKFFRGTDGIYTNHTYQHLYFLSDEEIKEGDWKYQKALKKVVQHDGNYYNPQVEKKIIATTNEDLLIETWYESIDLGMQPKYNSLPRPSNEFLEKYCELGGIDKVLVEYIQYGVISKDECVIPTKTELKVAPDNTISIFPI